jgi:hypothetical protein
MHFHCYMGENNSIVVSYRMRVLACPTASDFSHVTLQTSKKQKPHARENKI